MSKNSRTRTHKINHEVRFDEVRIIGDHEGIVMSSFDASKLAESEGKDLILINESARPPVVRIEDYSKFIYNERKRDKDRTKNSKKVEMKEIKLSLTIADHDLEVKSKKGTEFLSEGNKIKCSLMMKGRQNAMRGQGEIVMLKFAELLEEFGIPESLPQCKGNKWIMVLKPKK